MSDINRAGSSLIFEQEAHPPFSHAIPGTVTPLLAMIALAHIHIIISLERRDTLIVAASLGREPGVYYAPGIFKILPATIYVLAATPICAGGLTAILLNIILPGGYRQESVLPGITSADEK